MKIELEKEDIEFINNLLTTVKVNDKVVHLQSLMTVLNKLNTPIQKIESKEEKHEN